MWAAFLHAQGTVAVVRPVGALAGLAAGPAWRLKRLLRVEAEINHRDQDLHAHSDENGHLFRRKAATCSDPKRPVWPRVDLAGVIVAVG